MTAREKLAIEHPEKISNTDPGGCVGCPSVYGYLSDPDFCESLSHCSCETLWANCQKCWDRKLPEEVVDKFYAVGNVRPIFPDEFNKGERKQMYSLFMKEMTNTGIGYKLIEEKNDLTTISEKVKRMVVAGTPIDDLRIVKNVEFEFKCALKFKEDE